MTDINKGFNPHVINDYKMKMKSLDRDYLFDENDENSDEYAHFYFVGIYEGKEVIYEAVMYTLRLQHEASFLKSPSIGRQNISRNIKRSPMKRTKTVTWQPWTLWKKR